MRWRAAFLPLALACATAGCASGNAGNDSAVPGKLAVTVTSANGPHVFQVDRAVTPEQQERGLMYRTDLTDTNGMLFWPYPAGGGAPKVASFWMKNTPTSLDIVFIRADGTIAHIAENAVPHDETPLSSEEPVAAVLEVKAGRTAALGIAEGDKVSWPK